MERFIARIIGMHGLVHELAFEPRDTGWIAYDAFGQLRNEPERLDVLGDDIIGQWASIQEFDLLDVAARRTSSGFWLVTWERQHLLLATPGQALLVMAQLIRALRPVG
jgi:hypothetical protein